MPTPRYHGGAPLIHFPLTVPGFKGLNTQNKGAILGPEWATKLENTVLDNNGRVSSRQGAHDHTTTPVGARFESGIEYRLQDGTTQIVAITATTIQKSSDDGDTWSAVTGTASFTSGKWYLVNFNDFVIGFQSGEKPLIYNGTTGSQVADANAPTGGVGTSAFGRVWAFASDGTTLKYSALLDHTNWTTAGAGSLDLSSIWLDNDSGVAVTAYNNLLIVFGKRNILVFEDGSGSELGIDPTTMIVRDTIPGIGCLSQYSVQLVGGDVWFLNDSRDMISLKRAILEQKGGDLVPLSKNVSDLLRDTIDSGSFDLSRLRSAYSPKDRFYLLSLPTESAAGAHDEVGKVFVFDTRQFLEDGAARCVGTWNQLVPTVIWPRTNGDLLFSLESVTGQVFHYHNYADNGTTYRMTYESGWLDLLAQTEISGALLILKRLNGLFYFGITTDVIMKWAFDFRTIFNTRALEFTAGGGTAEWGSSEWAVGEWGGGTSLGEKKVSGSGTGKYIKIGIDATIDGGAFAIQYIDLLAKIGRMKG